MLAALFAAPAQAQDIDSNLVGHWRLDETSGTTATDSSGGGFDGTMTNGLSGANDSINGKIGTALDFDGNDYVDMGNIGIVTNQPASSICMWFNYRGANPLTEREMLIAEWQSGFHGWFLMLDNGAQTIAFTPSTLFGNTINTGASTITSNQWTHVCATFQGSTFTRLYVNGTMITEDTTGIPAVMHNGSLPLRIASQQFGNQFNGFIDDVRIYDRALSDEDVFALAKTFYGPMTCNAAYEAVMIFNHVEKVMQYCNGTDWVDMGPKSSNDGYFVEIGPLADADFGGIAGADATCLSTLQAGTWQGKADAQARNLLTASNVRSWLCTTADCNELIPNTRYRYASATASGAGGNIMTSTAEGYIEDDGIRFDNPGSFGTIGSLKEYYTGRSPTNTPQTDTCSDWASTAGSTDVAVSDVTFYPEKLSKYSHTCNNPGHLICLVDPQATSTNCTSPDGVGGEVGYNFSEGIMQFCDGANWLNMGPKIAGAGTDDITYTAPTSDLVGHWALDETSGVTASDSSASGEDGSLNGTNFTASTVTGINGNALSLDGSDDFVSIADSTTYDFGNNFSFSVSAWIRTAASYNCTGNKVFVGYRVDTEHHWWLGCSDTTNTPHWEIEGTEDVRFDGSSTINDGNWHLLTATYDGTTNVASLYVDGTLDASSTVNMTDNLQGTAPVCIGSYGVSCEGYHFNGDIDDVRIYSDALSSDDVYNLYRATGGTNSGLILHLPFDETSGTTAIDTTVNGLDGTLDNGLDAGTDSLAGVSGRALNFDGSDDRVSITSDPLHNDSTTSTYAGWFYPTSTTLNRRFFENGVTVLNQWSSGQITVAYGRWSGGYANWETATGVITPNAWQHIALTYDYSSTANDPVLYVNGEAVALTETTAPSGTVTNTADYALYVGNRSDSARPWAGRIDDFRYYNRVLPASEIASLYANTGGSLQPITGCPNIGDTCSDGTIYAGDHLVSSAKLYATPADSTSDINWGANGAYVTAALSDTDGEANTNALDGAVDAGSPYPAAQLCADLTANGSSDWYLPARDELTVLYTNQVAIGGFDAGGEMYWSSTESTSLDPGERAWGRRFSDGYEWHNAMFVSTLSVRCIRQGDLITVGGTCSSPNGGEGEMIYNDDNNIMQYCNGSVWVGIK